MSKIVVTVTSDDINISKALCDIIQTSLKRSMIPNIIVGYHSEQDLCDQFADVDDNDLTEQQIEMLKQSTQTMCDQANAVSTIMMTQPLIELKADVNVTVETLIGGVITGEMDDELYLKQTQTK